MRDALSKNAVRVIDMFREWDDDNSGAISKKEFLKAMPMLGLDVPKKEINALFDEWDPDKSGSIELDELNKLLRRGAVLDAKLRDGAQGKIETKSKNKTQLRKKKVDKNDSNILQGFDIDESSDKSVAEQVRVVQ